MALRRRGLVEIDLPDVRRLLTLSFDFHRTATAAAASEILFGTICKYRLTRRGSRFPLIFADYFFLAGEPARRESRSRRHFTPSRVV